MRQKPAVRVPLSETRWILTALNSICNRLDDEVAHMSSIDDPSDEHRIFVEHLRLDRDELVESIELLELRMREALTGDTAAPAKPEWVRLE